MRRPAMPKVRPDRLRIAQWVQCALRNATDVVLRTVPAPALVKLMLGQTILVPYSITVCQVNSAGRERGSSCTGNSPASAGDIRKGART